MTSSQLILSLDEKLKKGIEEYGHQFLIGYYELDNEYYEELINLVSVFINNKVYINMNKINMIISFALVNFAIKDYENNKFWREAAIKFKCDYNDIMKIGKEAIESFCSQNDLYFHNGNINRGFVTTILTHAIIPNSSLRNFLEFLQDIYFNDLEEDYIDQEVEELLNYMHRLFSKYLNEEDINLIVKGTKMTIARQHLPKSTRIAYVKSPSLVMPIIERLLYYIDQRNYGQIIEYLKKDRFEDYFVKYINDINNNLYDDKTTKKSRRSSRVRYFSVAQYYYDSKDLFLQVPRQIIEHEYIANRLYVEILMGDKEIVKKELLLTKSKLLFKTEELNIKLPYFHENISYRIKSGDSIIYGSQGSLYRDYLIFNSEGNEIQPQNLSDEKIKILCNFDKEILTDDAELIINKKSNYKVVTIFMNEESLLIIEDKVFATNIAKVNTEVSKEHRYKNVLISKNNNLYKCFSKIPEIKLRIRYGRSIEDYVVCINNQNYRIQEISDLNIKEIYDGSGDNLAKISLHNSVVITEVPLKIYIREKGNKKIYLEENIFVIEALSYEFSKNYYYKDKNAQITKLNAHNMKMINNYKLPMNIKISHNKQVIIPISIKRNIYNLIIKIPILSWQLSSIFSTMKYSDNVWHDDITDYDLFVEFPYESSKLEITTKNSEERIQGKQSGNVIKFSLEQYFLYKDSFTMNVMVNGNKEKITSIHFKPKIFDFFIKYYDRSDIFSGLYTSWNFCGCGELFANIIYSATPKIIKSYHLKEDEKIIDKNLSLYYGEHEIEIYRMKKDDFFAGEPEKEVLLHERFIVGDPVIVKCKNKTLKVKKCISGNKEYNIENFYLKNIDFGIRKGRYKATGFYYIKDTYTREKKEWYFTTYNPFILKLVTIKNKELEFEIVDREGDGLIYDVLTTHVNPKKVGKNHKRFKLIDRIKGYVTEG